MKVRALLVVCGYSDPEDREIHPICLARVRSAERLAGEAAEVLLSGGSKQGSLSSEAELMARAWRGDPAQLRYDTAARLTAENASAAVDVALADRLERIEVLTSWWHAPRAWLLFRLVAVGSGLSLRVHGCRSPWSAMLLVNELRSVWWLPAQIVRARRLWRTRAVQPA